MEMSSSCVQRANAAILSEAESSRPAEVDVGTAADVIVSNSTQRQHSGAGHPVRHVHALAATIVLEAESFLPRGW